MTAGIFSALFHFQLWKDKIHKRNKHVFSCKIKKRRTASIHVIFLQTNHQGGFSQNINHHHICFGSTCFHMGETCTSQLQPPLFLFFFLIVFVWMERKNVEIHKYFLFGEVFQKARVLFERETETNTKKGKAREAVRGGSEEKGVRRYFKGQKIMRLEQSASKEKTTPHSATLELFVNSSAAMDPSSKNLL